MYKLEVLSLNKKYKNKFALCDCSFKIASGEIVGIIGKNGAGKTTLFNLIAGNIIPTSGKLFFCDKELCLNSDIRKEFGILIKPALYEQLQGYEFLKLVDLLHNNIHTKSEIENILEVVGLADAKKKNIKSYSFGMKQRLCFANALLGADKFMMLDEPFVGLDITGREVVKNHIKMISKNKKIPIIFSDHNLDEVKDICTRIILLDEGRILFDGTLESFEQDFIITVGDTNNVDCNSCSILSKNQIKVKKSNLDKSLRNILNYTEISDIENVNMLNKLLDGEEKNV